MAALNTVYRYDTFCTSRDATAKVAAYSIWHARHGNRQDIREFDTLYRAVRYRFNKLEKDQLILKSADGKGFKLNRSYVDEFLI